MTASNTYTWTAQGKTSNWNDAGNWTPGGPALATDIAAFTGVDSSITGDATVGAILCEGAQTDTFLGTLSVLGVAGQPYAMTVAANAEVTFGPGAQLSAPTLGVGVIGGGTSLMTLLDSTVYTATSTIQSGSGLSVVSMGAGLWENTGNMLIGLGNGAMGDLSLAAGAELLTGTRGHHAQKGNILLGTTRGAQGVLTVSGGAVAQIENGNLVVGGNLTAQQHGTGQVDIGAQGYVSVAGTLSLNAGSSIALADGDVGAGTLIAAAGSLIGGSGELSAGALVNNTDIVAQGTLFVFADSITGTGSFSLSTGATLSLSTEQATTAIDFLGTNATLSLPESLDVKGAITGFAPGDFLLGYFTTGVSFDSATDGLTLYHDKTALTTLTLAGNYAGDTFNVYRSGDFGVITVKHG
jgi:hypothetical protein